MSMPQIPENSYRPDFDEVIIDLLEAIALEEISLSHILNAEGERIQAFLGKNKDFPTHPTNSEIAEFDKSTANLLDTVIMKEWILYKKLLATLEVIHKNNLCNYKRNKGKE